MTKTKNTEQLIEVAMVIRESVNLSFTACEEAMVEAMKLFNTGTKEEMDAVFDKAKTEVKQKLCQRWIPETEFMKGDVE